jgi:hypothetical protein
VNPLASLSTVANVVPVLLEVELADSPERVVSRIVRFSLIRTVEIEPGGSRTALTV